MDQGAYKEQQPAEQFLEWWEEGSSGALQLSFLGRSPECIMYPCLSPASDLFCALQEES